MACKYFCLEDKSPESTASGLRSQDFHFACKLSLYFSLTPGSVNSNLAKQFCRSHSCCPSEDKKKRVGQKEKAEDGK